MELLFFFYLYFDWEEVWLYMLCIYLKTSILVESFFSQFFALGQYPFNIEEKCLY